MGSKYFAINDNRCISIMALTRSVHCQGTTHYLSPGGRGIARFSRETEGGRMGDQSSLTEYERGI